MEPAIKPLSRLEKFKYSKTNTTVLNSALPDPMFNKSSEPNNSMSFNSDKALKTTSFSITNTDNHLKVQSTKGFVQMLKETLDKDGMLVMTKILQSIKTEKQVQNYLKPIYS